MRKDKLTKISKIKGRINHLDTEFWTLLKEIRRMINNISTATPDRKELRDVEIEFELIEAKLDELNLLTKTLVKRRKYYDEVREEFNKIKKEVTARYNEDETFENN
jgi:chromosome segregation ATPase